MKTKYDRPSPFAYRDRTEAINSMGRMLKNHAIMADEDAADIRIMRKKQIEKLIQEVHKNKIFFSEKKNLYYTQDPDNKRRKISARDMDSLYEKLYERYFGEQTFSIAQLYPFWREWIWERRHLSPGTIRKHDDCFRKNYADSEFATRPIKELTAYDVDCFLSSFSERATRHQLTEIKTILNGIYDYAVIRDIVPVNVARNCNTRTIRTKAEQNDPYNVYTQSDRAKILLALKDSTDSYDLVICMMFCLCCRVGEIEAMHFEDINPETQEILIHSEIVYVTGIDGNSGYFKEADYTKTGDDSGVDLLPLTATAMEIVNRCTALYGGEAEGYIFKSASGGFLYTKTFNRHLKAVCEQVGIRYRSSHKIRFYTASALGGDEDMDMATLMRCGRWKDPSTAMHYQRMAREKTAKRRAFDRQFG